MIIYDHHIHSLQDLLKMTNEKTVVTAAGLEPTTA